MNDTYEVSKIKIPFDSLTLRAVAAELREDLLGGQIQDIRQPLPSELRLGIRSKGKNWLLALSDDARFARVHLTLHKQPNAPTPPSFCMALRKHCEGAILRDIRQRGFDRVLELEIESKTEEGGSATVTLIAELMGKHSNLILVNAAGVILDAAKRISRRVSRFREVLPGIPYQPPPEQSSRLDPFDPKTVPILLQKMQQRAASNVEGRAEWLMDQTAGLSPFLALEIAYRIFEGSSEIPDRLPQVWQEIFGAASRNEYKPVVIMASDKAAGAYPFPTVQFPVSAQKSVPFLNFALDDAYSQAVEQAGKNALLTELRGQIQREEKRLTRQKEIAERGVQDAERAEEFKQIGELILANVWRIEPGAKRIVVQDYFDPEFPDRILTLDPKLSPQENADVYFRRYRKYRDGQETSVKRKQEADALLETLNIAKLQVKQWETAVTVMQEQIMRLREELKSKGLLQTRAGDNDEETKTGPDLQGHKIRRYTTPEGFEIYLGETATANDYLTTRLAASNDIWLHVRASTSAHVVIRTRGKPEAVPKSVIQRAALLCAKHSSQKHSTLVPVDSTLKKHVRKPRGAAPGSADYHHETTLHVNPQE